VSTRGLRLGTRASALALAQARAVARGLGGAEIVEVITTGDRTSVGDKSRWVKELEQALLRGDVDLAVHSAKDVPAELPEGLVLAGVPPRADARDVLCGAHALTDLPPGARVGTSSPRRRALLLAARDDLDIVPIRGNVDTRLVKLHRGDYDAIVLALAGLERLDRPAEAGGVLDPDEFVPAAGQGALALEVRADDRAALEAAAAVTDHATLACLRVERQLTRTLGATCHTSVGAHARPAGSGRLEVVGFAGREDGSAWVRDRGDGPDADPEELGHRVGERLLSAGAAELLAEAQPAGA
jgi:hydroxymethylbilane synthase